MTDNLENAKLAETHADILDDFSRWLRAYSWEVEACGQDGALELQQLRERAPRAVKVLAGYLGVVSGSDAYGN